MKCKTPDCGMPEMRDGYCQECHRAHALEEQTKRIQSILGSEEENKVNHQSIQKRQRLEQEVKAKPRKPARAAQPKPKPVTAPPPRRPSVQPAVFTKTTSVTSLDKPPKMYDEPGLCLTGPCKEPHLASGFCTDCDELYQDYVRYEGNLKKLDKIPSQFQLEAFRKKTASTSPPEA